MINQERTQQKIDAINAKDVEEIVAKNIYIPTLGHTNTVSQVQNWLDKRVGFLENALVFTEQQITTFMDNMYDSLTGEEQTLADQILAGDEVEFSDEETWENLVPFIIFKFISD